MSNSAKVHPLRITPSFHKPIRRNSACVNVKPYHLKPRKRNSLNSSMMNLTNFEDSISKLSLDASCSEESSTIPNKCRICLDSANNDDLIEPCICKGSVKFVHKACLKHWLETSNKSEKDLKFCEICHSEYKLKFYISYLCECNFKRNITIFLGLIILFVTVGSLVSVVIGKAMDGENDPLITGLMIIFASASIFCGIISIFVLKDRCVKRMIRHWNIEEERIN